MVQINDQYYEDLTRENFEQLLDDLAAGRPVKPGSQIGRQSSEPHLAVNTLTEPSLYDGSVVGAWRKRFEEEAAKPTATGEEALQTATMPEKAKIAKPLAGRPIESPAADTPAERVSEGERPIDPAERAGMSSKDRATVVKPRQEKASAKAPQSTKSYAATPSNPEEGRPVASQPTTPVAGTPPSEAETRRDGTESDPDVVVDKDNKSS
jgi:NADH-quinone oxidoreductase subunit E